MRFSIQSRNEEGIRHRFVYDNLTNAVRGPDGKIIDFWEIPQLAAFSDYPPPKIRRDFSPERPIVGKAARVSRLKIQLGLACNYHCSYCMQAAYRTPAKQPDAEEIDAFVESLEKAGITLTRDARIQYWGGEPLVYIKTLRRLIPKLRALYPNIPQTIVTNGSLLTRETVDFLLENRVAVTISHDAQGFCLRDDKDPLDDPEKKAVWLYLRDESLKRGLKLGFNVVLTAASADLEKVKEFFRTRFAPDGYRISIEGIVTDDAGASNTRFDENARKDLVDSIYRIATRDPESFPALMEETAEVIGTLVSRTPAKDNRGKCSAPALKNLVTDLRGNIVSCQNRDGEHFKIGRLEDLANVRNNFLTHFSARPKCLDCEMLAVCKGSCPHMDPVSHASTCVNEKIYAFAKFKAAWFVLTGEEIESIEPIDPDKPRVELDDTMNDIRDIRKIYLMMGPACNLKCRHCYQSVEAMPRPPKEVAPKTFEFLRRLAAAHREKVNLVFWGGEPLLYLPTIRSVLKELPGAFDYWLMSNGVLLTDEIVDFLNENHIGFSVSNDGPDTAKVRGVNVFEDKAFLKRFARLERTCVGVTTHAYNIDPAATVAYIQGKVGVHVPIYYQYHLECTHPMPEDLYEYDIARYEANLKALFKTYWDDVLAGKKRTASVYALDKGVAHAREFLRRKHWGLAPEWYPECRPMRHEMNIDTQGVVHLCHNRDLPFGTVDQPFEALRAQSDRLFSLASAGKPACENCDIDFICRHGCPLTPESEGQRRCCEAERTYWKTCYEALLEHEAPLSSPRRTIPIRSENKK